ncbi:MAG: hypothetical protein KDD53_01005 [Bdellovibrionales bacterium]|nr:hypothetical protein [Bdellovibrionales bacterium]
MNLEARNQRQIREARLDRVYWELKCPLEAGAFSAELRAVAKSQLKLESSARGFSHRVDLMAEKLIESKAYLLQSAFIADSSNGIPNLTPGLVGDLQLQRFAVAVAPRTLREIAKRLLPELPRPLGPMIIGKAICLLIEKGAIRSSDFVVELRGRASLADSLSARYSGSPDERIGRLVPLGLALSLRLDESILRLGMTERKRTNEQMRLKRNLDYPLEGPLSARQIRLIVAAFNKFKSDQIGKGEGFVKAQEILLARTARAVTPNQIRQARITFSNSLNQVSRGHNYTRDEQLCLIDLFTDPDLQHPPGSRLAGTPDVKLIHQRFEEWRHARDLNAEPLSQDAIHGKWKTSLVDDKYTADRRRVKKLESQLRAGAEREARDARIRIRRGLLRVLPQADLHSPDTPLSRRESARALQLAKGNQPYSLAENSLLVHLGEVRESAPKDSRLSWKDIAARLYQETDAAVVRNPKNLWAQFYRLMNKESELVANEVRSGNSNPTNIARLIYEKIGLVRTEEQITARYLNVVRNESEIQN